MKNKGVLSKQGKINFQYAIYKLNKAISELHKEGVLNVENVNYVPTIVSDRMFYITIKHQYDSENKVIGMISSYELDIPLIVLKCKIAENIKEIRREQ